MVTFSPTIENGMSGFSDSHVSRYSKSPLTRSSPSNSDTSSTSSPNGVVSASCRSACEWIAIFSPFTASRT
jgi:hypothetical protein